MQSVQSTCVQSLHIHWVHLVSMAMALPQLRRRAYLCTTIRYPPGKRVGRSPGPRRSAHMSTRDLGHEHDNWADRVSNELGRPEGCKSKQANLKARRKKDQEVKTWACQVGHHDHCAHMSMMPHCPLSLRAASTAHVWSLWVLQVGALPTDRSSEFLSSQISKGKEISSLKMCLYFTILQVHVSLFT